MKRIELNKDPHADPMKQPRCSSPLSFFSKAAFLLATLSLATGTTATAATTNGCVCNFDPNVDYFPNKIAPQYSTKFTIEYFKSYKKLTLLAGGEAHVTYAYLCGTPVPNLGSVNNTIEIPIQSVALTSTTFLPFIEYIGERDSLEFVSTTPSNLKACTRKMYDEGKVAADYTLDAAQLLKANATASARTGGQQLDVVFMDAFTFGDDATRNLVMDTLGPRTKAIYIGEVLETSPLGRLEWVEVVAAFFNKEYAVLNVATRLNSRYNCVKNLIAKTAPQPRKKKVLWGYCYYDTWIEVPANVCYVASCPNYYCDLIEDAGGEVMLVDEGRKTMLTTDEMYTLAEQADVWLFGNANWNASLGAAGAFFTGELKTKFSALPVVQNQQVYDYLGRQFNDWFDDAPAQPGVVLMDFAQVFYGSQYVPQTERTKDFWRNVFTDPIAFQGERVASQCVNASAPLYAAWDEGFCTIPATTEVMTIKDRVLCVDKPSAGVASAQFSPLALLAMVMAVGL